MMTAVKLMRIMPPMMATGKMIIKRFLAVGDSLAVVALLSIIVLSITGAVVGERHAAEVFCKSILKLTVAFTPFAALMQIISDVLYCSNTLKCSIDSKVIGSLLLILVRLPTLAPLRDVLVVPTMSSDDEKSSWDPLSLIY